MRAVLHLPGVLRRDERGGPDGLPSQKLCPRDAIRRKPIGGWTPTIPLNNFYEYIIDEKLCNGCGKCVMDCKEPAGLGSIRLRGPLQPVPRLQPLHHLPDLPRRMPTSADPRRAEHSSRAATR